jgi:hypothetical protein
MRIEDVDVFQAHPLRALIERGDQVFARRSDAVQAGPHAPSSLGGDDKFVAMIMEILLKDNVEVLFRGASGWSVVLARSKWVTSRSKARRIEWG